MFAFRTCNRWDGLPAGDDMIHVEEALANGRQALEEGRLRDAQSELQGVLELDENEPRALRLMAKVVTLQGEPEKAVELLKQALETFQPEERLQGPRPTPTLAELYARQGHTEAAAEVYRQLIATSGGDERAEEWRRRLAALESQEGEAPASPEVEEVGAEEEAQAAVGSVSEAAEEAACEPEVDPAAAERRLQAFLDRLDGNQEVNRLRRFLERLENRPSQ